MSETFPIPANWTFNDLGVAQGFDRHVREQLPWYDLVTAAIVQVVRHYLPTNGLVYDIGAANGNIARALSDLLTDRKAAMTSIEPSAMMVTEFSGPGLLLTAKASDIDYEPFDVAVCFLVLMFMTREEATETLRRLTASLRPGGALIIVERMLPPKGYPGIVTSRLTLAAKSAAGVPAAEIIDKELSLAGAQRPIEPSTFARLGAVEWFRFGDFAGYIVEARA